MSLYRWIVSMLVWLSADPAAIDLEAPKASAAVAAARASMAFEAAPAPAPKPPAPKPPAVCSDCGGRGYIVMPDGHRVVCPNCKGCKDGKCPQKNVLR
jgi:anaerobic selenocysteine-containing dehydrogenase